MLKTTITIEFEDLSPEVLGIILGATPGAKVEPTPAEPKEDPEPKPKPRRRTAKAAEPKPEPKDDPEPEAPSEPEPVKPEPEPKAAPEPEPEADLLGSDDKPMTEDQSAQIVKSVTEMVQQGHHAKVRAALDKVGVAKAREITTHAQAEAFLTELNG